MLELLLAFVRDVFFFTGYVQTGSSFPEPLGPEQERVQVKAMLRGDPEARSMLIEHNLRLVAHIARKYANARRDVDDLISIGAVGLIKAVATYRPDKSNALASYAAKCIENEILMSLRAEKKQAGEVSISDPIGMDKDGNEIALADILGGDPEQTHNIAALSIASAQLRTAIDHALSDRERTVIRLRYGLMGGRCMPQREVAALLGISRSYISRIEKKALQKLKDTLKDV